MTLYEAWSVEDVEGNVSETVFSDAESILEQKTKGLISSGAVRLYRFEAATWEEAMSVHHLRMGYEPYKPGSSGLCPTSGCDAFVYPEGSGECWKCKAANAGRATTR
jgi:hypothetical protein